MGCSGCSNAGGLPKGCKNNGSCGINGCDKLTVFDWLSNMEMPEGKEPFDIVEVRFKNGRKEFFKNIDRIALQAGDIVAVEASPGHDVGTVSLHGELVRIQMQKKGLSPGDESVKKVYRKASQKDIDTWHKVRQREEEVKLKARELAAKNGLIMKISDVEFQGDGSKATFYYTADERVDFRQLIRDYASAFKIRVEMRQIGARQEAGRIGGIGSCGRELCCATWLTDFRSVNTSAARYQQLSLNPQKLAGQCGKLKCCLNYELDTYLEVLKSFPDTQIILKTKRGEATFMKMDIFKRKMWYAYADESINWVELKVDDVNRIIEMNREDEVPESLELFSAEKVAETVPEYSNVVGQDSLTRFDKKNQKGRKKGRGRKSKKRKNQGPHDNRNRKG